MSEEKRLTEEQLANRWQISVRTLQMWRRARKGPPFMVIGTRTVLYREEDVRAYENAHIIHTNNPNSDKK